MNNTESKRKPYVREMKRYGILPASFDAARDPIDVYATDRAYWAAMGWHPAEEGAR